VLVDPGRLEERYANHGRFHDEWETVPKPEPSPEPDADALVNMRDEKTVSEIDPDIDPDIDLPATGYRAARERFDGFLEHGIRSYADTRDDLARAVEAPTHAVSRMSPYLATGRSGSGRCGRTRPTRSRRRRATSAATSTSTATSCRGASRCTTCCTTPRSGRRELQIVPLNEIAWREDDTAFEAWTRGETGYPLVDAGMRQLNAEGTSTTARDRWSRAFSRNTS